MAINSNHITGFLVGLGVAGVGFYVYRKNQRNVDAWLNRQGINVQSSGGKDPAAMSMEELVIEKEQLEDLIAEREMAAQAEKAPEAAG